MSRRDVIHSVGLCKHRVNWAGVGGAGIVVSDNVSQGLLLYS